MTNNLFLDDTTYPHLDDADDYQVLVIDEAGNPVLETCGSSRFPANYSFECVNNFVHCEGAYYEELQYLALGMATHIEQQEKDSRRYRYAVENMEIMSENGMRGYVGREEADVYIDAQIAKGKP